MQSAIALSSVTFSPPRSLQAGRMASIRSNALSVNYNSSVSVFPAEACETIGGDTCAAHMYPEVKPLPREASNKPRIGMEAFEREYLDYAQDPRTVRRAMFSEENSATNTTRRGYAAAAKTRTPSPSSFSA